MSESINYIPHLDLDDNQQSLKMFGLKGLKFRGIELDNYGTGFDPRMIGNGDGFELLTLQFKRYLLRLAYLILSFWNWSLMINKEIRFKIFQILINVIYHLILILRPWYFDNLIKFISKYKYPIPEEELVRVSKDGVPNILLVIINLNQFIEPLPPMIPEPYLTFDKKLVVPTKREINLALKRNVNYTNALQFFKQNESFAKMMIVSKCVKYCALIGLKNLQLYESTAELWSNDNLTKLMNFINLELSDNCEMVIKLIHCDSGREYYLSGNGITESNNEEIKLTISLLSLRQSPMRSIVKVLQEKGEINASLFVEKPELMINVNKDLKKMDLNKLMGLPVIPNESECVVYTDNHYDLSIDQFYKGFLHWQLVLSLAHNHYI